MATTAASTAAGRLKAIRGELGLTQREFASGAGLSYSMVTQSEIGAQSLGDRSIRKICAAYSVNEEWLKYGDGTMFIDGKQKLFDQFATAFDLTPDQRQQIAAIVHFRLDGAPTNEQRSAARKAARIIDAVNHGAIGRVSMI